MQVQTSLVETIRELISQSEYDKAAETFLKETNTRLTVKYKTYGKHFPGDKDNRDIYRVTISRKISGKVRKMSFDFGQSLKDTSSGTAPGAYSILTCLTKYDPGTFEDFCSNYGYDTDSRTAEKTYKAVCKEYNSLTRLYDSEELEAMAEIQ